MCGEREKKIKWGEVNNKASDRVKTDQYLRRHISSQIVIAKDLNDVVTFMNQLFATICRRK